MSEKKEQLVQPVELEVNKLFQEANYVIPIYQRNYAWGSQEIEQLLDDISGAVGKYHLGSLIVNQLELNVFEVIDGQQRLTTLFLLLSYISKLEVKVKENSLRFEAREKSNRTLHDILLRSSEEVNNMEGAWYSEEIIDGYKHIKAYFRDDSKKIGDFKEKLKNVDIIRIQVPKNIDLNHYFEIMNTRGEQLELHEIAKAKILGKLENPKEKYKAGKIWDACAQMDKYVQMSFGVKEREQIFGETWGEFQCKEFSELIEKIDDDGVSDEKKIKLRDILDKPECANKSSKSSDDEEEERFESIIAFANFILNVNEAMLSKNGEEDTEDDTGLDDTKLINKLKNNWKDEKSAQNFIFHLLKYRFWFDKYIIKRTKKQDDKGEYKIDGNWSLKRLKKYRYKFENKQGKQQAEYYETFDKDNYKLLMLESCLRVTYTSPKTMHWISQVLAALDKDEKIDIVNLLEKYCCGKIDKKKTVNKNNKLDVGSGFDIERIVFTYLDYILWRDKDDKYKDFQFQFRTSIEHFYPQHPINGKTWGDEYLNSFGNLALVTVSANSKFSNMIPTSKVENYEDIFKQSPKLIEMKEMLKNNNNEWDEKEAGKHNEYMIDILTNEIIKNT